VVKKNNPHPFWRTVFFPIGLNPPNRGNVYPLHLQTGSISDAFPLAPFASPLRTLWLKKIILTCIGEPSFSRLAPILPNRGNFLSAKYHKKKRD